MCRIMRNPVYCIYENKYADKLRRVRAADRCLCFLCLDSTNYLEFILYKYEISSFQLSSYMARFVSHLVGNPEGRSSYMRSI